jgi:hypothetical protein
MMATEKVSVRDLYPARRPTPPDRRRLALAWLLAGVLTAIVGRRLLAWADRNL